jgi:hypothetical protein
MEKIGKWNVVHRHEGKRLLWAINGLAGLSIFFFGYDQVRRPLCTRLVIVIGID